MNAITENDWTRTWRRIGQSIPKPTAILAISAHWYISGTAVTSMSSPRTIHDFGGFPRELYQVQYPAPGSPELAERVCELLAPLDVQRDASWGLDHGTWSVLYHVFPDASIPIVQLSIDERRDASFHFQLGKNLLALREEGVLIIGSGNLVHNLHAYSWGNHPGEPYDWALRFEQKCRELLSSKTFEPLVNYEQLGRDANLSIPTPDHYLPLLYVLGLCTNADSVHFPVEGCDGGSVSMLTVQIG